MPVATSRRTLYFQATPKTQRVRGRVRCAVLDYQRNDTQMNSRVTYRAQQNSPQPPKRLTRPRRLARRVILPLSLLVLTAALALNVFAHLTGSHASPQEPYTWEGETIRLTGGSSPDPYTSCAVDPEHEERRWLEIPGSGDTRQVTSWFEGTATVKCGRSVSVMAGWPAILYPYAASQPLIAGLTALAIASWWLGRTRSI